jgi:hypothetical protein
MSPVTYDKFREDTARMFEGAVESAYKDLLEKAVAEAVAAERQRCAQIAREFDRDHPNTNYGGYIARLIEETAP